MDPKANQSVNQWYNEHTEALHHKLQEVLDQNRTALFGMSPRMILAIQGDALMLTQQAVLHAMSATNQPDKKSDESSDIQHAARMGKKGPIQKKKSPASKPVPSNKAEGQTNFGLDIGSELKVPGVSIG